VKSILPGCLVAMLGGCASTVNTEGIDALGLPLSTWFVQGERMETVCIGGGGHDCGEGWLDSTIVVSDEAGGCARSQSWLAGWIAASDTLLAASDDGRDEEAFCKAAPAYLRTMVELENSTYGFARKRFSLGFTFGDDVTDLPPPGDYTLPSDGALDTWGILTYGEAGADDPDAVAASWNTESCAREGSSSERQSARWELVSGSLELETAEENLMAGKVSAQVVPADGSSSAESGSVEIDFAAARCELPPVGRGLVAI
jgi:hypothetical protein